MPHLIAPTPDLHADWLAARDEWGRDVIQHGSGQLASDDVDTADGFAAWVARLHRQATAPEPGWVPAAFWWITDGGALAGAISLRFTLNDFLLDGGGHIGYGVRPSARGRGLASWALGEVLAEARARGLDRVLITCDETNEASARVIERNGGVLEDVRDTALGRKRRYWVGLSPV